MQTNQNEQNFPHQKLVAEMKDSNPGTRQSRKGAQLAEADLQHAGENLVRMQNKT